MLKNCPGVIKKYLDQKDREYVDDQADTRVAQVTRWNGGRSERPGYDRDFIATQIHDLVFAPGEAKRKHMECRQLFMQMNPDFAEF